MEVLHAHCAGLDIHMNTVVACVRHMAEGKVRSEVKTFKTTTQELMALSDWLSAEGCTHIGMEATGVCWNRSGTSCQTASSHWCWPTLPTSRMCREVFAWGYFIVDWSH
jgi:hypothetical protein